MVIVFHDYETYNFSPIGGAASQWASVTLKEDFSQVSCSNVFCLASEDTLPELGACRVTHQTPESIAAIHDSLNEYDFVSSIHEVMTANKNAIIVGYNSLNFDDEWNRHLLYRNLYPAYNWHFSNGNSRYDGLLLMRAVFALRPHLLTWNYVLVDEHSSETRVSFKLENLSSANKIKHDFAHNAYSDVEALKELMHKIKIADSDFYDLATKVRSKHYIKDLLEDQANASGLILVSPFEREHNFIGYVLPLCQSSDPNIYWVWDAKVNPEKILSLSLADKERLMTMKKDEMDALGINKKGLIKIKINSLPNLFPKSVYDKNLDNGSGLSNIKSDINSNIKSFNQSRNELLELVRIVDSNKPKYDELSDFDCRLYSGGFNEPSENTFSLKFHKCKTWEDKYLLIKTESPTDRMTALGLRIIGRNAPNCFDEHDKTDWQKYLSERFSGVAENCPIQIDKSKCPSVEESIIVLQSQENDEVVKSLLNYYKSK